MRRLIHHVGFRQGLGAAARAHARLGIAVTRGLLVDLVATRDVAGINAAIEAFIDAYTSWLRAPQ